MNLSLYTFTYLVVGFPKLTNEDTVLGVSEQGARGCLHQQFKRVYPNKQIQQDSIKLVAVN